MPLSGPGIMSTSNHAGDAIAFGSGGFNYPVTAYVEEKVGVNGSGVKKIVHKIWYAGTPASDSNFNNAPDDSEFVDTTNKKWYGKTAASTWTVLGTQS